MEDVVRTQTLYVASDGFRLADADSPNTMPAIALTKHDAEAESWAELLFIGVIKRDTWSWVKGASSGLLFQSTTPGEMTQTQPAGSGDQVQVLGTSIDPKWVYFNPSLELIQRA